MIILAIKTDTDTPELKLFNDEKIMDTKTWSAGRMLARDLPRQIEDFLKSNNVVSIDGYAGYLGPGSFTGLRIGITALNALAYVNNKPIVGASESSWCDIAIKKLLNGENESLLIPSYGAEAHITPQKK